MSLTWRQRLGILKKQVTDVSASSKRGNFNKARWDHKEEKVATLHPSLRSCLLMILSGNSSDLFLPAQGNFLWVLDPKSSVIIADGRCAEQVLSIRARCCREKCDSAEIFGNSWRKSQWVSHSQHSLTGRLKRPDLPPWIFNTDLVFQF